MSGYWIEFSQVAVAHLLAVASPGPDFAIVVRHSVAYGRRTGIWTSVGVGAGILFHVAYSLLGLGLLIQSSTLWFNVLRWAGAAYLTWLGIQALRSSRKTELAIANDLGLAPLAPARAFVVGFFTNALNPKATLFFVSLFALVVSPGTPALLRGAYGVWMALATAAWFSAVSILFTTLDVRERFQQHAHWIDRALGVLLLGFAAALLLSGIGHE